MLLNTLLFTFVPFNITLTFLFLTVTRSKTKAMLLDIDLEDLLAAEEAERIQRLENGYESEDSLAGDESEEDEADLLIDPEFSRMKTPTDRFVDDLLFDVEDKDAAYDCAEIIGGSLPPLTDSEEETPPSHTFASSLPPSAELSSSHGKKRKRKKSAGRQAYEKRQKKERRNQRRSITNPGPYNKKIGWKRFGESDVILLDVDAVTLPIATTGWQGVRTGSLFKHWSREQVFQKLRYLDWDAS